MKNDTQYFREMVYGFYCFILYLIICSKKKKWSETSCGRKYRADVMGERGRQRAYIDHIPFVRPLVHQQCDRVELHSIALSLPQHRPLQEVSLCVCVCVRVCGCVCFDYLSRWILLDSQHISQFRETFLLSLCLEKAANRSFWKAAVVTEAQKRSLVAVVKQKWLCKHKAEVREVNLLWKRKKSTLLLEVQFLKAGRCAAGFTQLSPEARQTRQSEIQPVGTEVWGLNWVSLNTKDSLLLTDYSQTWVAGEAVRDGELEHSSPQRRGRNNRAVSVGNTEAQTLFLAN